jgi:hypothetical protein
VSLADEVCAEHVYVIFHSTDVWVEKVRYHSKSACRVSRPGVNDRIVIRDRYRMHSESSTGTREIDDDMNRNRHMGRIFAQPLKFVDASIWYHPEFEKI